MKRGSLFLSVSLLLCVCLQPSSGQLVMSSARSGNLTFWNTPFPPAPAVAVPAPGPTAAGESECVAPLAGMVGWWPGEGNSGELVNGSPGVVEGLSFVSGKVGQAFVFDTCSPGVVAPASPGLDVGAGSGLTLEMWYWPRYAENLTLADWAGSAGSGMELGQAVGDAFGVPFPYPYLYANLQDTIGRDHYISAPVILTTNRFQHIAVTYDKAGGVAKLYLDGSLVAQSYLGSFTPNTIGDLHLGGSAIPRPTFRLDEISLYNRALGEAEIAAIASADAAGKCRSAVPPVLLQQPRSVTALSGNAARFTVLAAGTPPLSYQWQHDGHNLAGASAASLNLTNLSAAQAGSYAVVVSNAGGCVLSFNAELSVIELTTDEFQIIQLAGSPHRAVEPASLSATKQQGIAAGPAQVFLSSDAGGTEGFDLESLASQGVAGPRLCALASNLGNERIYSLGKGTNYLAAGGGTVTTLIELDGGTLQPTGAVIPLTQAIELRNGAGIFSGVNRLVLHDGTEVYDIALPSGVVKALGQMAMPQHARSGWAYWGVAEYFNGAVHLAYIRDPQAIVRTRVPDGRTTEVSRFDNLGQSAAAFSLSLRHALWYIACDAPSQFGWYQPQVVAASALLAYCAPQHPPIGSLHLADQVVREGEAVVFEVAAFGELPLAYQWQFNGIDLPGATEPQLTLAHVTAAQVGSYSVRVSNRYGSISSLAVRLSLEEPPVITRQPQSQSVEAGGEVVFEVEVSGTDPRLQWRYRGQDLDRETNATLRLSELTPREAGEYTVVASNRVGTATSQPASLTVRTIALGEALDTGAQLVWSTGGSSAWFGQAGLGLDGAAAAQGGRVKPFEESWIETTVTGPGTVMFHWKSRVESYNPTARFSVDGQPRIALGGGFTWRAGAYFIPAGTHTLRWTLSNADYQWPWSDGLWLDQVKWIPGDQPAALSLDSVLLANLQSNADAAWWSQKAVSRTGRGALQSSGIAGGHTSTAGLEVRGPGRLSFWWKVSSEAEGDFLQLWLDSELKGAISGEVAWQQRSVFIPAGEHWVGWRYTKNLTESVGQDAGWVEGIRFTPELPPVITQHPASRSAFGGNAVRFHVQAASRCAVSYQWQLNGVDLANATSDTLVLRGVGPYHCGQYRVVVDNGAGRVISRPALLKVVPKMDSRLAVEGATVTFRPSQFDFVPRYCSWTFGWYPLTASSRIRGTAGPTLKIQDVQLSDAGAYSLVMEAANGAQSQNPAQLRVIRRGAVMAWGDDLYFDSSVPEGLSDIVAVAAGNQHNLALRGDGTVAAWGESFAGADQVPEGLSNVVAIAANGAHSLALKADGTVVTWGHNSEGLGRVPAGLSGVTAIAAGYHHSLALKADGTVVAWGENLCNQLAVPEGLTNVVAISAGAVHSLAVTRSGRVVAWGDNSMGQTNVPASLSGVVAVAAGAGHSLALKRNGTVVGWGSNYPYPGERYTGQASVPAGLDQVVALAAGTYHNLALRRDGTVLVWGCDPGMDGYYRAYSPVGMNHVAGIAANYRHSLALRYDPVITTPPATQTATAGETVELNVQATGREPLAYQWQWNGQNISGATNTSLALENLEVGQTGNYSVVVTNRFGRSSSKVMQLKVCEP